MFYTREFLTLFQQRSFISVGVDYEDWRGTNADHLRIIKKEAIGQLKPRPVSRLAFGSGTRNAIPEDEARKREGDKCGMSHYFLPSMQQRSDS